MNLILLSDTHIKQGQSLLSRLPEELISIIKSCDLIITQGILKHLFAIMSLIPWENSLRFMVIPTVPNL